MNDYLFIVFFKRYSCSKQNGQCTYV